VLRHAAGALCRGENGGDLVGPAGPAGNRPSKIAPPIVKPQAPARASAWIWSTLAAACGDHGPVGGADDRARDLLTVGARVPVGQKVESTDPVARGERA
jgi:hypothetical protein